MIQRTENELRYKIIRNYAKGICLDYGCGNAELTNAISYIPEVRKIFGYDIDSAKIIKAKKKYKNLNLFILRNPPNIPLKSNSIDFLFCTEVLEHVIDVNSLLKEFYRILKINGYMVITTTDYNWLKRALIGLFCWERYFDIDYPHIRFFTKKTLRNKLTEHNLKIVKYIWNGSYFGIIPCGQLVVARKE